MSNSSPRALRAALRTAAQQQGIRLEARPFVDLGWMVSSAVDLIETPAGTSSMWREGWELRDRGSAWLARPDEPPSSPARAWLAWSAEEPPQEMRWRWADDRLLLSFAGLAGAPASQVVEFAKEWGPLWLCEHGLPVTHQGGEWRLDRDPFRGCERVDDPPREDVDLWRRYASEAAAIIEVIIQLKKQCPVPLAKWEPLAHLQRDEPWQANVAWPIENLTDEYWTRSDLRRPAEIEERDRIVADQREAISVWLNWWLDISGARPHYDPLRQGIIPVLQPSLFGAIAYQLASLMAGPKWIIKCHACGEYDERDAKPQAGRNSYCELCREKGRRRDWARKNPRTPR